MSTSVGLAPDGHANPLLTLDQHSAAENIFISISGIIGLSMHRHRGKKRAQIPCSRIITVLGQKQVGVEREGTGVCARVQRAYPEVKCRALKKGFQMNLSQRFQGGVTLGCAAKSFPSFQPSCPPPHTLSSLALPRDVSMRGRWIISGAGKTTLATALGEKLGLPVYYEPVADNEYLEDFYRDKARYAFPLQVRAPLMLMTTQVIVSDLNICVHVSFYKVYLLNRRFQQHQQIIWSGKGGVQDRTIYEDTVFARVLQQEGNMEEREYQTYSSLFSNMSNFMYANSCFSPLCSMLACQLFFLVPLWCLQEETQFNCPSGRDTGGKLSPHTNALAQLRVGYTHGVPQASTRRLRVVPQRYIPHHPCNPRQLRRVPRRR